MPLPNLPSLDEFEEDMNASENGSIDLTDDDFENEQEEYEDNLDENLVDYEDNTNRITDDEILQPFVHPETIKPKSKPAKLSKMKELAQSIKLPKIKFNKTVLKTVGFTILFLIVLFVAFSFLGDKLKSKKAKPTKENRKQEKTKEEEPIVIKKIYKKDGYLFADVFSQDTTTIELQVLYEDKKDKRLVLCSSEQQDLTAKELTAEIELFCSVDDIELNKYKKIQEQYFLLD